MEPNDSTKPTNSMLPNYARVTVKTTTENAETKTEHAETTTKHAETSINHAKSTTEHTETLMVHAEETYVVPDAKEAFHSDMDLEAAFSKLQVN